MVENSSFQSYSTSHIQFYDYDVPKLLETALSETSKRAFSILDLGCGDGRFLFSLQCRGLLKDAELVVGVDISEIRIRRLVENVGNVIGLVSDACNIKELNDQSFDVIICSQLIEHVPSDHALLREIRRLLKDNGYVFISSVIKKPHGFWIYRHNGAFRLDPTHVREYPSKEAFLQLLEKNGFEPRKVSCGRVKYSIADLLVRALITMRLYKPKGMQNTFLRHRLLTKFRKLLKLSVLGYEQIEVLASLIQVI